MTALEFLLSLYLSFAICSAWCFLRVAAIAPENLTHTPAGIRLKDPGTFYAIACALPIGNFLGWVIAIAILTQTQKGHRNPTNPQQKGD